MRFCIIGYGSRGSAYAENFYKFDGCELTAVCDVKPERLTLAAKRYNLKQTDLYNNETSFFSAGKLADICVVSTPDAAHVKHAIAAMETGYDLLLEKPIAVTEKDCEAIYKTAVKLNRKVFVCHVLRYSPFFASIKEELRSGDYGRLSTVNLTENVAYWHQAHSYVRGNWHNSAESSPMILAKCCHDLDLLAWFAEVPCENVSSMGSLNFFTKENAPKNSAERCLDCPAAADCVYNAVKIYDTERFSAGVTDWPVNVLCDPPTREGLNAALKSSDYGKCVFRCNNDVVDHQVVNLEFKGGITAHLTMTAFSEDGYREIHVHGEKGEIFGNMLENKLHCNIYGKSKKVIDVSANPDLGFGHGGGDYLLVKDIVSFYKGEPIKGLTEIGLSMQSHRIAFAAEASRLKHGQAQKLK